MLFTMKSRHQSHSLSIIDLKTTLPQQVITNTTSSAPWMSPGIDAQIKKVAENFQEINVLPQRPKKVAGFD